MKPFLIILLSTILLSSCGAGISDYEEDLGNNYVYTSTGGGVRYIYKSGGHTVQKYIDTIVVMPTIQFYKHDSQHIISQQKPDSSLIIQEISGSYINRAYLKYLNNDTTISKKELFIAKSLINKGITKKHLIEDQAKLKNAADSLFRSEEVFKVIMKNSVNYYIIDKMKNKTYGPFDKSMYQGMRKKIGVSKDLQLEE